MTFHRRAFQLFALFATLLAPNATLASNEARVVCQIVLDAETGATLHETGSCDEQVTPASTFKLALAVIGFDAGLLHSPDAPVWQQRAGEPDWGGPEWRQPTDPAHWMAASVVWYSQRLTRQLGAHELARYVSAFDYGNRDLSGGLDRAWLSSSLTISPRQQTQFLGRMLRGDLPVSRGATQAAMALIAPIPSGEWQVFGKTGAGFPRHADGSLDRAHGYGWFVGWAERDGQAVVFARLEQEQSAQPGSAAAVRAMRCCKIGRRSLRRSEIDFTGPEPRLPDMTRPLHPTALVTGGNRGLGRAIAAGLKAKGCRVTIGARDPEQGRAAAAELGVSFVPLDLQVPDQAFTEVTQSGGFDILVNNAGVLSDASLLTPQSDFDTAMEVMVNAPLDLVRLNTPHWRQSGWGRVVNISSDWGSHAAGLEGPGAYGVAKAALNALTRALARDLPDGVKINACCPGWVQTRMGGTAAALTPEQGADTPIWLATLPDDGPTGGFFRERKPLDW